jgi:predicted nuclease with RNAse H fold
MHIIGLDLAGVEKRPSGFCILNEKLEAKTFLLYNDKEILHWVNLLKPNIISVDAPLALPKNRCCLKDSCSCKNKGHLRECDKMLLKMGIKFFPLTLGAMRTLTLRGLRLKSLIEENGFKIIETYPGAAQDLLGIPRKKLGIEPLRNALIKLGVKGDITKKEITDHELDALTCALTGKMYLEGDYLALGDPNEILMILPKPRKNWKRNIK